MSPKQKSKRTLTRQLKMGKRYKELVGEGKKGPEAAEIINKEFGTYVSYASMKVYGYQYKISGQHDETLSPVSTAQPARSDELEALRVIVKQIVEEMMTTTPTIPDPFHEIDVPPEPEVVKGKGGKQNRKYVKVTVTIDQNLWDKFTERRNKMRVSSGRLMDIILWRAFERPPLTYEAKDHQDNKKTDPTSITGAQSDVILPSYKKDFPKNDSSRTRKKSAKS